MHSFGHRANAVATFAVTILAAMCFAASFSDSFNSPTPAASVKVPFPPVSPLFPALDLGPPSRRLDLAADSSRLVPRRFVCCVTHAFWVVCFPQILNINWFQKEANANDEVISLPFLYLAAKLVKQI
jgi:hypothetical protein